MLENVSVGQRSGVRPVWGSVRSQKKAKVRCSRVSRNACARGEDGSTLGTWASLSQPKSATGRRARSARQRWENMRIKIRRRGEKPGGAPGSAPHRGRSSEIVLYAYLEPARIADDASRCAEIRS